MKIKGAFPVRWMSQDGSDGLDAFAVILSPATLTFTTKSDGTLEQSSQSTTLSALCGTEAAEIQLLGVSSMVNCKASFSGTVVTISNITTSTTKIDGTTYTAPATSGYAIVTAQLVFGSRSEVREVTVPFTVSVAQVLMGIYTTENSIGTRVSSLESDGKTLKSNVSDLQTSVDGISATVKTNTTNISNNTKSITSVESSVSSLTVESEKISAKTKAFTGVNILSTDSTGKEDSASYSEAITSTTAWTHTFFLRKGITNGNTYRLHLALHTIVAGSKVGAVNLYQGTSASGTAIASISSFGTLVKGTTYQSQDFTSTSDIAAGSAMTLYVKMSSVASGDTITAMCAALLYDLEQFMLDTGFDVFGHTFLVTANNFVIQNNAGLKTLSVDSEGNLLVRGTVNNDILYIDTHNQDSYIYDCPSQVSEVFTKDSRSADTLYYDKTPVPNKCLDLLRIPSVTVFGGIEYNDGSANGFYLPSAQSTAAWCRTKTKYLSNSVRWMTFADLQMLVGRSFTFINRGQAIYIGYDFTGETAIMLGHGEFISLTLKLDATNGYAWEVIGGSTAVTIESEFAGTTNDWDVPVAATLTKSYAFSPANGKTTLSQVLAGRTYNYLSGSSWTSGTLRFDRSKGGNITIGSNKGFALLNREQTDDGKEIKDANLRGIPFALGTKHVQIRMNQGYQYTSSQWAGFGIRLLLWSVVDGAVYMCAQSPRFDIMGNTDMLDLDLTEIIDGWSETTQCYLGANLECYTGDHVGDSMITPPPFTLEHLGLQITEY